ncbi:hypothetical protein HanIR_Chr04g0164991 [Helianthus annuus]|nr:hypothetical protein HanIR_Chr04g0164991 [Helianthus annuus]
MFDFQQIAEGRRCGFVEGWRILKIWRLYLKFEIKSGIQGEVSEILVLCKVSFSPDLLEAWGSETRP